MEGSTGSSVVLAGIYLKVGLIGLMRFVVQPMGTELVLYWMPLVVVSVGCGLVSVLAHIVGNLDIKRYIASCSVVHMMYTLLGL